MVFLNNFIHHWGKSGIRVVTSGINTNSRIDVLASGPNGLLERETVRVLLVVKLVPDILGQALAEEGFGSWWEDG
jgi:hypothetical protein